MRTWSLYQFGNCNRLINWLLFVLLLFSDEEDSTDGATSTDSTIEAINQPPDDSQLGPPTSAGSQSPDAEQNHAVASTSHQFMPPSNHADATENTDGSLASDDIQNAKTRKPRRPGGRGRPRVRRGRKRR